MYWAASGEDAIAAADFVGESSEVVETLSEDARETLETTGTATIVRDGGAVAYSSINEAVGNALDGETVLVEGTHALTEPIKVTGGKSISLIGKGQAKVVRGEGYPQSNGKPDALVLLSERSSLTIEAENPEDLLSFDGEKKDSDKAIIVVDGASQLVMGAGSQVENASASWKPWGGVYVKNGSFVLDGGKIVNGFAYGNAAVAVERAGSFEMRSGEISGQPLHLFRSCDLGPGNFLDDGRIDRRQQSELGRHSRRRGLCSWRRVVLVYRRNDRRELRSQLVRHPHRELLVFDRGERTHVRIGSDRFERVGLP